LRSALAIAAVIGLVGLGRKEELHAQTVPRPVAVPLPPMGWSSWNSFSNTIDSQITINQAKAMIASGMAKAGYRYVNIDEGWWLGQRDASGNIVVEPKQWPALAVGERDGDMSNIVRYIHGLGLKAGIYTDAGKDGCSTVGPDLGPSFPNTGSEGHYEQDFLQFAKWGFDYVKVDWCGGSKENLDPAVQYAEIARAIALAESATGHELYYSICNWGNNSPFTWAPGIGGVAADIWRTSGDIVAPIVAHSKNSERRADFPGMLGNFDKGIHPEAQHTGFYNDPDMMVIGMPGLSDRQNRVHMALWAISGAPLIAGADLTTLSEATRATLTNPAVIAIDQDPLGLQASRVGTGNGTVEVWSKPLAQPGSRAVLLLNRGKQPAPVSVDWKELGLAASASGTVSDAWAQKDAGEFAGSYTATVPAEDAMLVVIRGQEEKFTHYQASEKRIKYLSAAGEAGRSYMFTRVRSSHRVARIDVDYVNATATTRIAELRVNGQIATRVAFPSTGGEHGTGRITIQSLLDIEGASNQLTFSVIGDSGPVIESISVQ